MNNILISQLNTTSNLWRPLSWCIAFLAFLAYALSVHLYSYNEPLGDDFPAVLDFLNGYAQAEGLQEKLKLLFGLYNEHRILTTRVVSLLTYWFTGHVNFVAMIWVGNLALFLTVLLVVRKSFGDDGFLGYAAPSVLFALTFSQWDLMTWPMASIQQYAQLFFALLCISCLTEDKPYLSYLCLVASVLSGGGGLFLIPILLIYFLIHGNKKQFFIALTVAVSMFLFYFVLLDYVRPLNHHVDYGVLFSKPWLLPGFVVTFLGSMGKSTAASMLLGCILLWIFLRNSREIYLANPFVFWSLIFILITAGLTALSRMNFGLSMARSSRYSEYSLFFAALLYAGVLSTKHQIEEYSGLFRKVLLLSLALFCYWFYVGRTYIADRHHEFVTGDRMAISFGENPPYLKTLELAQKLGTFHTDESHLKREPIHKPD